MTISSVRFYPSRESSGKDSILLHPTKARWIRLNASGREIVEIFRNTESPTKTAKVLSRRYSRDPALCRADVQDLLQSLDKDGYFEISGDPIPPVRTGLGQIQLKITSRCNLSCAHCLGDFSPARKDHLTREKILSLIDQSRDLGATFLALSGGEPLLHADFRLIVKYASERMKTQIATNGTLIDESTAAFLASVPVQIQISLDGPSPDVNDRIRGQGAFDSAVAAIGRLHRAGLSNRMILATTMMAVNIDKLDRMIDLARSLGIPRIRFLPLRREGRASRHWSDLEARERRMLSERFYERVRRSGARPFRGVSVSVGFSGYVLHPSDHPSGEDLWCPLGSCLVVAADGEAYPCAVLCREGFALGDTRRRPLSRILDSPAMKDVVQTLRERRNRIEKCAACLWKNLCQAGCMGLALDQSGSVWETDDFCSYRKRAYASAFREILARPAPDRRNRVLD